MLKTENIGVGVEKFAKFLVLMLIVFIPARNVLELWLGTIIKIIPDVTILTLALLFFVYKKGRVKLRSYDYFIVLFLMIAFVNTVLIQKISVVTYIFEVRSIMVYYILFFVIREFEFEKEYMKMFTKLLRCITYVLFVFGVIEKLWDKMILFPYSVAETIIYADNYARVYSLFFNPNTYGAFLVISFFYVIHFEKEKKHMLYKVITIASLLLSMSRSSILILMIGLGVYAIMFRKNIVFSKALIIQVTIIILSALMIYTACETIVSIRHHSYENGGDDGEGTSVLDRFSALKSEEIIEESNTDGRLFYLKTGLKVFKDYPVLGTGFGTYGSAASMNWEPPIYEKYQLKYGFYSDNEYIKDLVETGTVGVMCLLMFCVSLIYVYKNKYFSVFMCVVVAWFGLFYNVLEVQIVAFLFWTVLGIQGKKLGEQKHEKN